jgi:hypothetical protein
MIVIVVVVSIVAIWTVVYTIIMSSIVMAVMMYRLPHADRVVVCGGIAHGGMA